MQGLPTGVPRDRFGFAIGPETDQPFENALAKARAGTRLSIDDAIALLTTGSGPRLDAERLEAVVRAADQRRREVLGEAVTFAANLNANYTTVCTGGCLFCSYRDGDPGQGSTHSPAASGAVVKAAVDRGVSEVTAVGGLHPALALDEEHRELLAGTPGYRKPSGASDPGTYRDQLSAMDVDGVHIHGVTPEEADHARRGTDWSFEEVYRRLQAAGLDSVPGTAAEILVEEVREVICPAKIATDGWLAAMEAAAGAGLPLTATMLYGHVENEAHRAHHLAAVRALQDRTGAITEFVPLSFVHQETPLATAGMVDGGATRAEDRLLVAVARLFLDNIDHIQASWVKYGDSLAADLLEGGADDLTGTLLAESITRRAGGEHGQFRSIADLAGLVESIGRVPVERSTTYERVSRVDPSADRPGPVLGPRADGTPLLERGETFDPASIIR